MIGCSASFLDLMEQDARHLERINIWIDDRLNTEAHLRG